MQTQFNGHQHACNQPKASGISLALHKQNLIRSAIAMLTDQEIQSMSRQDLLDALRMVRSASPSLEVRTSDKMELTELRRLLAISREYFRSQTDRKSPARAWSPELN